MTAKQLLIAATLGASGLVAHLHDPPAARAQSTTTGAIQGVVTDKATGEELAGVSVTVTSTSLQGAQTAITDESGAYKISPLPPGEYTVTFYYLDIRLERTGIIVGVNKTTPVFQQLDQGKAGGEVVKVTDSAPSIDPTSTAQGITIDKSYIKNIPVPGRTFESVLGAAAGSQGDALGVSFSGSTSLENQYYVDGVNTTGLTFGTVGSPIINDFIEEIEVITGGYNAEFGRATGGIVNVVTKSGSNELRGSIFSNYRPGFLTAQAETAPVNASSIDVNVDNAYQIDFGLEVGGPIVKDRVWFYVGFVPRFERNDITRITKRQTDCRKLGSDGRLSGCNPALESMGGNADGAPDVDPATGFYITDELDREIRADRTSAYNFLGKVNFAVAPEHQGQVSLSALPRSRRQDGVFGPIRNGFEVDSLVTDVALKWTSKLNDNRTELEAVLGWHRERVTDGALDPLLENQPLQVLQDGNLLTWGRGFQSESQATLTGCEDNTAADPYRSITNCPMDTRSYIVGGPGSITDDREERRSAKVSVTQRVKAAGNHELKAGLDLDDNISDKSRIYSGGAFIENFVGAGAVRVTRWVQLLGLVGSEAEMNNDDPRFDNVCRTPSTDTGGVTDPGPLTFACDYLGGTIGSPGTRVQGNTLNWSAYLRDSWQVLPNLTLNLGVRYEEQRLRYSSELQDKLDPLTQVQLGKNAMALTGNFAPRVGVLYDWTKEGRSKVYAHWGRFYESIPMQINDRSFGGESNYQQLFLNAGNMQKCGGGSDPAIGGPNGNRCVEKIDLMGDAEQLIGASGVLVAPGIKAQFMEETIAGFEYELIDDLKIGVSFQNRRMRRVIEDVSTDGAQTYIIANPGEWSEEEEAKLVERITRTDDAAERQRLENQLRLFQGIRIFDRPRRDYNALQFTVTRRFSRRLYIQGSYTFSRTQGNYPGLFSPDNGQVDPNISSQYDLIELLGNRIGPLPYDRPHYIKLDGYYSFDVDRIGDFSIGARVRALSGVPINALGAHYLYGPNESFLLPRGELGRTNFEHGIDVHVGYGRRINKRMRAEVFVDLFNMYNRQGSAGVDDNYAPQFKLSGPNASSGTEQNANPVSGGSYEDLIFLKAIGADGQGTSTAIGKNPNFRNTNSRYTPTYVQFGARLTF